MKGNEMQANQEIVVDSTAAHGGQADRCFDASAEGVAASAVIESRPMRDRVSAEEWQTRVDLAACYRLMDVYDMTDMVYNHISVRVPGEPDHFLINAYGLHYSEITASNLHKINHNGDIVERAWGTHLGVNPSGFVIHRALHRGRPDIHCIIHTHTRAGTAVSAMKCGLLPLSLAGMKFARHIGYHDCEGLVVGGDEEERLIANLGAHDAMILRNHGLLVGAPTIAEAFNSIYMLERACQTQVDVMVSGADIHLPAQEAEESTAHLMHRGTRRAYGVMEWEAMLRLLDRRNPGYRD
jgi:ribulose-5-phosphate 4-epimerase/fuculose-1-phosphate aldolase